LVPTKEGDAKAPKDIKVGTFFFYLNHAANANQTVGSEFSFDSQKNTVSANIGLSHKFNDDTSAKFKIDRDGQVNTLLKHKLNNSLTASVTTGFNLTTIVAKSTTQSLPLGLSFDLKL
jgi:hypothetical protein